MWKDQNAQERNAQILLRHVKDDLSESRLGFSVEGALKRKVLKQRMNTGTAAMDSMSKIMCFLTVEVCKHPK